MLITHAYMSDTSIRLSDEAKERLNLYKRQMRIITM